MTIKEDALSRGFNFEYGCYEIEIVDIDIINKIMKDNCTKSIIIKLDDDFSKGEIIANTWIEYDITSDEIESIIKTLPIINYVKSIEINDCFCKETQYNITDNIYLSTFQGKDYLDIVDYTNKNDNGTPEGITLTYNELALINNILKYKRGLSDEI